MNQASYTGNSFFRHYFDGVIGSNRLPGQLIGFICLLLPVVAHAETASGIQPLHQLHESQMYSLIQNDSIRPLVTADEQIMFLKELERSPPNWDQLHDPPGEEHGARLFDLNRNRDELREEHPLLKQQIAFIWSGILREYHEEHKGFKVVIGPKPTQTSWGIVRFKPTRLPNEMVAIPSEKAFRSLKNTIDKKRGVEIGVLFVGTLIPWESIIYGFSHDGLEQGMIMPVVQIDSVQYIVPEQIQ